jgi:hypothetical protein
VDEVDGEYSTQHERDGKCKENYFKSLKGKGYLENCGIDGSMILICITNK